MDLKNLLTTLTQTKNGVVEGSELSKLKVWVDDNADAKTDAGELQDLSKHGITQIVIPQKENSIQPTQQRN